MRELFVFTVMTGNTRRVCLNDIRRKLEAFHIFTVYYFRAHSTVYLHRIALRRVFSRNLEERVNSSDTSKNDGVPADIITRLPIFYRSNSHDITSSYMHREIVVRECPRIPLARKLA